MKKSKAWIGITAGLVCGAGLTAAIAVSGVKKLAEEVHICEIDDLHGKLPGYGDDFFKPAKSHAGVIRLSQEIQKIVSKYPGSIVLAGGDQNSSGPYSTCAQGDTMYPVLSAMNIPYSVVGNHAWDFGGDKLTSKHFQKLGKTDNTDGNYFVTSNVLTDKTLQEKNWVYHENEPGFASDFALWQNQRVKWADPYKVINMGEHKIAFIGLTTQGTREDGRQSELTNTCFIDYLPAIHYTKYQLKKDIGQDMFNRIEAFVLYTHVPANYDSTSHEYGGEAVELTKKLDTNIDLFLAAHSHQDIATTIHNNILNKDIPILEAKADSQSFADATLLFDNKKPEGSRLKGVKVKTVGFDIPEDINEAAKQIAEIRANPYNDVVKKTIKVYDEQKEVAKSKLNVNLAKSTNGLTYDLEWGYHEGYNNIEPAGAFAAKANVGGFEMFYKKLFEEGRFYKPSISIISKDSIQQAIEPGDVKLRDIYGLYPFDNKPIYFTLTYHQLEQIVQYSLTGADRTGIERGTCTDTYYYDDDNLQQVTLPDDLRFPYAPTQFYGFKFDCTKLASHDDQGRVHSYKANSLKVYDPNNSSQSFDDPDTWGDKAYWSGKLIAGTMNNFSYNGGNKQYQMIRMFAQKNAETHSSETKAQVFAEDFEDARQLPIAYLTWLGKQEGMTVDLTTDVLNKLFHVVTE